ncbi:unnamed protein product [Prorocentrum cordatum]|uniref:Uncharacterized protein n=1 Tax=Prorocentrum cordatum TaxID=2364126 RepID=A0ABN9W692_9DINO|nr:unnamed protein product [Polarella glacialis]
MYKPRASAAVKSALCPGTASWAATAERENAKSLERSDWLASTHSNLNFGAQNWLLQMLWRDNKKSCLARGRTETTRREPNRGGRRRQSREDHRILSPSDRWHWPEAITMAKRARRSPPEYSETT